MSRFNQFVSALGDKVKKVSKKAFETSDRAFHHKQKIRVKGREYVVEKQLGEGMLVTEGSFLVYVTTIIFKFKIPWSFSHLICTVFENRI
jgi:hypothetical protein